MGLYSLLFGFFGLLPRLGVAYVPCAQRNYRLGYVRGLGVQYL
jgi:hypothetical protein